MTREMCVHKYIPNSLYGFAQDDIGQVFFHLGAFNPSNLSDTPAACKLCHKAGCTWGENPPPPVLGERVIVETDEAPQGDQAPRAKKVSRVRMPQVVEGVIDAFDANRGFGFIKGSDGITYHLHRSEMVDGRLPQPGQQVMFYAGTRQGRPRACHTRICP
jgi:cold shock CspA family protein